MNYKDFQRLSDNEKSECLWDKGKPVATYNNGSDRFVLYQVEEFYVEAQYKTDFMEVVGLKALETKNLPEKYLGQINISGLGH